MDRWRGKLAVVTGAGSGIGAAISRRLLEHGVRVAGLDLRFDGLTWNGKGLHKFTINLAKGSELEEVWNRDVKALGPVSILVNNAGITDYSTVIDSPRSIVQRLVDVNFVAMAHMVSLAVSDMKVHNTVGHIFMTNSILAHRIPLHGNSTTPGQNSFNVYPACKHGTLAMTESIRWELAQAKLPIKITSLSPGLCKTNIDSHAKAVKDFMKEMEVLDPLDVASALIYSLSTPPDVEISEITLRHRGEFP